MLQILFETESLFRAGRQNRLKAMAEFGYEVLSGSVKLANGVEGKSEKEVSVINFSVYGLFSASCQFGCNC